MGKTIQIQNQLQLVTAIKSNDEKVLETLYKANYKKIELYILKNSGTIAQAKDIYQEAFITTWKNIKSDKFLPQNETAVQGYLYQIAKNKWTDYLRSSRFKKTTSIANTFIETREPEEHSDDEKSIDNRIHIAMSAFNKLGASCKELLTKFYFNKQSVKLIAEELNLEEASVRNKKYRCMQKLKTLTIASNKN